MSNRINPTGSPVRISANPTVERQTPKSDFGTRMKAGLDTATGALAAGAAVAAPFVPGLGIVSAAVSSMSNASQFGSGAVASQYSRGANIGGVDIGNSLGGVGVAPGGPAAGSINQGLAGMQNDNIKMMELQMAMQRENTVFSAMSNVLKVRHDTQKNSISNIR